MSNTISYFTKREFLLPYLLKQKTETLLFNHLVAGGVFVAVLPSEQLPSFNIYCYKSPKGKNITLYTFHIFLEIHICHFS